jgi:peptidoglycan/xylan/chitin deacetylase (PgdA/CDA1 family)
MVLSPPFPLVRLAAAVRRDVLFFVETNERVVALTLDDGPHPLVTPRVLDVLSRHGARATFFLLGSRAEGHPSVVRRIAAEGHELGNHTWEEECSACLPPLRFEQSLSRTHRVLTRFGAVCLFRPGSGWTTRRIVTVAERHGYRCVLGSVYPQDARVPFRRWIVKDVLRRARPGAIIILHEGTIERARVTGVLDEVLRALRHRGYRVTTVSDLLSSSS